VNAHHIDEPPGFEFTPEQLATLDAIVPRVPIGYTPTPSKMAPQWMRDLCNVREPIERPPVRGVGLHGVVGLICRGEQ
jgi:hypothetical protein